MDHKHSSHKPVTAPYPKSYEFLWDTRFSQWQRFTMGYTSAGRCMQYVSLKHRYSLPYYTVSYPTRPQCDSSSPWKPKISCTILTLLMQRQQYMESINPKPTSTLTMEAIHLPDNTKSETRRPQCKSSPSWNPQISLLYNLWRGNTTWNPDLKATFTLKMEIECSSKMAAPTHPTTQWHNPKDHNMIRWIWSTFSHPIS
jgi:hypothetical protein